jgi:hypothetical protein
MIARGGPVERPFGLERLRLFDFGHRCHPHARRLPRAAVDSRRSDSIHCALGKLQSIRIEAGALHGRVKFNQTREGDRAAALIAAGSAAISLAYGIEDMEIFDRNHARLSGSNLDRLG